MKSRERFEKLKDLGDDELEDRRDQMAEEAFRLRFQWAMEHCLEGFGVSPVERPPTTPLR